MSLTDARGFRAEMAYDGHGRQSRWIFPSKTVPGLADQADYEEYRHDPNGNRTSLRKRDGRMIGYEYDALDRMTLKVAPAPVGAVRYAYDNRGLQLSAWFPSNSQGVSHGYDGFGRLASTESNMGGASRTVSHLFDRDGRRVELAFPDGRRFWFRRDGLGRMTEAWQGALGDTSFIMAGFAYNAAGLPSYFARRWGDASVYGYDGALRLASLEDAFAGAPGANLSTFAYNPAGQLGRETRSNPAYAWTGAKAAGSYAVNGLNQYVSVAGTAFAYDANGNLTSDGATTYAYDAENRLISASGARNATLSYDPLGRLWQVAGPSGTTRFLWDGDELVAEYDGSGNLLRRYVHGDGNDDPLFWYEGATLTQPRFPHADRQGSIVAVAGAGTAINTYDEYGIPGAANVGRFQYTGQAWIAELGLYYYKARFYSPRLGRFMQTDPIGYDDQINLYAYVGNDPLNHVDPTGEATSCVKEEKTVVCTTIVDPENAPERRSPIIADNINKNNPLFSRNGVGNSALDQAAAELGGALPDGNREGAFKMVESGPRVEKTLIAKGGIGEVAIDPSSLKGADGFFHVEPTLHNTGVPGLGDINIPARVGIPNYSSYGGNVTAVEISGGRAQLRPINHKNTAGFQDRANDYQARRTRERRQFR